jgi:hypothetical protein
MSKKEIREYLDRVERLELTLLDEDKETLQWLIYGYNQCAKLLNETEQENIQLKTQLLEKKCSDKDIEYKEKNKLQQRIDKAIEVLKLCNSQCSKEVIEILKGVQ